jgi:hypothetical protein
VFFFFQLLLPGLTPFSLLEGESGFEISTSFISLVYTATTHWAASDPERDQPLSIMTLKDI